MDPRPSELCERPRQEILSYVFFVGLIAATFVF